MCADPPATPAARGSLELCCGLVKCSSAPLPACVYHYQQRCASQFCCTLLTEKRAARLKTSPVTCGAGTGGLRTCPRPRARLGLPTSPLAASALRSATGCQGWPGTRAAEQPPCCPAHARRTVFCTAPAPAGQAHVSGQLLACMEDSGRQCRQRWGCLRQASAGPSLLHGRQCTPKTAAALEQSLAAQSDQAAQSRARSGAFPTCLR